VNPARRAPGGGGERFPGQPGKFDFSILRATWLISVPFLTPLDFQGVPKSTIFEKNHLKMKKRRSQKRL
jgi:hypothetical protein